MDLLTLCRKQSLNIAELRKMCTSPDPMVVACARETLDTLKCGRKILSNTLMELVDLREVDEIFVKAVHIQLRIVLS